MMAVTNLKRYVNFTRIAKFSTSVASWHWWNYVVCLVYLWFGLGWALTTMPASMEPKAEESNFELDGDGRGSYRIWAYLSSIQHTFNPL